MAHAPFPVEVLTPEGSVFKGDVEMISTRTSVGSIGILARHQPMLAMLDFAELKLYTSETEIERFAQGEGYLQVHDNRALVLVEEATPTGELNRATLETKLKDAQQRMEVSDAETEEHRIARQDVRRWEIFLSICEE